MPPASTMSANTVDPFRQFGQLSLDPYSSQPPPADDDNNPSAAPAPGTPPTGSKPGNPMMTGGYGYPYSSQQQQHHQQQPMQVSPEQTANPALGQPQGQMQMQQQPQGAHANYQYNQYAQPPQPLQLQPNMQPFQAHGSMTMPAHAQQQQQQLVAQMSSPPISPLWTPTSPDPSPPEEDQKKIQQGSGMPPSLPTGFAPSAGASVPTLPPVGGPAANPFDASAPAPALAAQAPPAPPADPFGSGAPPVQPPTQQQNRQDEADFWNNMGFGNAPPANDNDDGPGNVTPTSNGSDESLSNSNGSDYPVDRSLDRGPVSLDERGLPAGGEYYRARVTTPMLGAIFSSGRELRSTLYKTASDSFVEAIGDRPVISFTIDGSAADTAGIGLGHVLLKVNDQEISQTDQAVKMVGSAARPMIMEFYIPNKEIRVVKTEGQCMVKYDNHSTEAPASACEWKPKYVVVGDMLGKPHILYMYRSKAEYDIAVKESQTRNRALSVKVKQFDIRGAKIFHERGTVQYPNKPKWHYFTVVRGTGLPIKISARTPEELYPVYEGIVGFLDREARVKKLRIEQNRERMQMHGMYRETYY